MTLVTPMGMRWPDEYDNPYIDDIGLTQQDMDKVKEDEACAMIGGGDVTLVTNTLTWTAAFYVYSPRAGNFVTINANSITIGDGQHIYFTPSSRPIPTETLTLTAGTTVPEGAVWCGTRSGTEMILRSSLSKHALDSQTAHSALSDNTNFNATGAAHGFCPKLSGNASEYLNGTGGFTSPAGSATFQSTYNNETGDHNVVMNDGNVIWKPTGPYNFDIRTNDADDDYGFIVQHTGPPTTTYFSIVEDSGGVKVVGSVKSFDVNSVRITDSGNVGIKQADPTDLINTGSYFKPDNTGTMLAIRDTGSKESFVNLISGYNSDGAHLGGVYFTRSGGASDAHRQVAAIQARQSGTGATAGGSLLFFTKNTGSGVGIDDHRMIIDPVGNVGIGILPTADIHLMRSGESLSILYQVYQNEVFAPTIQCQKSRGTSDAPAIVQDGDGLFMIRAEGYDGASFSSAARIKFEVDGTPGSGDMPGRIGFYTTPNGSGIPIERVRINNVGVMSMLTGDAYTNAVASSLSVGYESGTPYSWIQSRGAAAVADLVLQGQGGNVGINTSPSFTLHVGGSTGTGVRTLGGSVPGSWALYCLGRNSIVDSNKVLYFDIPGSYAEISTYDYGLSAAFPMVLLANGGNLGLGEVAPETKLEITDTAPYVTLHNSTEEDAAGGRESRISFKGEQSGGEETTLARIQASHDGTGDDQKGDLIFYTNDGSDGDSPTERLIIDSAGDVSVPNTSSYSVGGVGDTLTGSLTSTGGSLFLKSDGTKSIQLGSFTHQTSICINGSNGRVGILDPSPSAELDVNGDARVAGIIYASGDDAYTSSPSSALSLGRDSTSAHCWIQAKGAAAVEELRIQPSGGDLKIQNSASDKIGFYGVTPVVRPALYTYASATATRTLNTLGSSTLTDNSGGSADTTIAAITEAANSGSADVGPTKDAIADLAAQVNNLHSNMSNMIQVITQVLKDFHSEGLLEASLAV